MVNSLLPPELLDVLQGIRPVFHAASWESFLYLVTGLLLGYARARVVRASLVAPSGYHWRRLHAFVRRNRWRESELLQALPQVVWTTLYPAGWPSHLFWVLDTTYLEKVYAQATEGVLRHYRPHPKRGQGRLLYGHGLVVLAHLYQETPHRCRALLLGGLLYLKQATWVDLGQQLVQMVPFPPTPHNVLVVDRGLTSLKLAKPLQRQGLYLLGRVKANATFYLPATEEDYSGHGRRPTYGAKFRADAVPLDGMDRREMPVPVEGQRVDGTIYRGTFLRRGVPDPVDLVRVEVGTLPPWLLLVTDRTLSTEQVIWGYEGRSQVEVALGDCKDLGLDTYRGRREAGIRHWPMIIGVVHSLLQLLAVGAINVTLPPQAWPWYRKETTVGAIQRRVIQWMLRRHFFDLFRQEQKLAEIGKAA